MLLPGSPLSVSGEWAGKTEGWPVFPIRAARAPFCRKCAGTALFAAIRAAALRAARPSVPGAAPYRGRALATPTAAARRQGSTNGIGAGIGGERRPRGAPGAFRALTGTDIGEKNRNVKENIKKIGEKSRGCPGAFPPAKRNIAAIFKLAFERGLFRADFVALSLRSGGRYDLWRRFASARTPASISSRVFGVPR